MDYWTERILRLDIFTLISFLFLIKIIFTLLSLMEQLIVWGSKYLILFVWLYIQLISQVLIHLILLVIYPAIIKILELMMIDLLFGNFLFVYVSILFFFYIAITGSIGKKLLKAALKMFINYWWWLYFPFGILFSEIFICNGLFFSIF